MQYEIVKIAYNFIGKAIAGMGKKNINLFI
jgi:hypothetical protein